MKAPLICSALVGLLLSPPVFLPASTPPFDYEQWRREHPRSAAKRLADLDVGAPRTVRMIYFLPNDRPYQAGVVDSMKTMIRQLQTFYSEQMQAHGQGEQTFRLETDDQGELLVHRVDGQHPDSHYLDNTFVAVLEEVGQVFDVEKNVYFVVIDNSLYAIRTEENPNPVGGAATSMEEGGMALVSEEFGFGIAAHELTHAFGLLWHDFRDERYILSYGLDPDRLSDCNAGFLAVNPYFNPDREEPPPASPPYIERMSPDTYREGAESVSVELSLRDPDGLHQVFLFVTSGGFFLSEGSQVKACRAMAGEKEAVVAFEYDGSRPSNIRTSLSNVVVHPITVAAVDMDGNVGWESFDLRQLSAEHLATLSGFGAIESVSFSPDGATLVSGTESRVEVWDLETGTNLPLEHPGEVRSVAFLPDGTRLVSGSTDGTIQLWESGRELYT